MEGVSTTVYKGLRGYWRRKGYEKLNRERRISELSLTSTTRRRRFSWRFKIRPKLKISRLPSPKKWFIWLRDAYVKMMMGFADSRVCASGYGGDGLGGYSFGNGPLKEYDEKMIVDIYKSLVMAQGQLVSRDAAKLGSQLVCRS